MKFNFITNYKLSNFLDEIEKELSSGHFLSTLIMSLMIPDVCAGPNTDGTEYKLWIKKYYYNNSYISKDFDEKKIYMLRCSVLHSAITYDNISLRFNSAINPHIGHVLTIIKDNNTRKEEKRILGLNINEFAEEMVKAGHKYIKETQNDPFLFSAIDYDKIQ